MMKRFLVFVVLAALSFQAAYSQTGGTTSAKQIKAGEVVQLGEGLTLRVAKATKAAFADVKVKGEPVVVVLDLEGSKKGATLFYKLNADPKLSDVQLTVGTQRLAPRAVVEDFPSWGKDNDKEVDIVDSKAGVGSTTINFERKGSVSLLFDVPSGQAKAPQKLSLMLRTIKPNDQHYSFVVSL